MSIGIFSPKSNGYSTLLLRSHRFSPNSVSYVQSIRDRGRESVILGWKSVKLLC
jgi:hypothetical protein